jgi:uncharacterized protein
MISNWPSQVPSQNEDCKKGVGTPVKTQAIILGLGSLFNHSTLNQNVGWTRDIENRLIIYTALRDIRRGEELCISYGDRLTFVDADARILQDRLEEENMLAAIQIV